MCRATPTKKLLTTISRRQLYLRLEWVNITLAMNWRVVQLSACLVSTLWTSDS